MPNDEKATPPPQEPRPTAAPSIEAHRAAMDAVADLQRRMLLDEARAAEKARAKHAKEQHGVLAEVGHTAALAAATLRGAALGQGIGKAEIGTTDLDAVLAMLRDIQNRAHLAFLAAQGAEDDYQATGRRLRLCHSAPHRAQDAL